MMELTETQLPLRPPLSLAQQKMRMTERTAPPSPDNCYREQVIIKMEVYFVRQYRAQALENCMSGV